MKHLELTSIHMPKFTTHKNYDNDETILSKQYPRKECYTSQCKISSDDAAASWCFTLLQTRRLGKNTKDKKQLAAQTNKFNIPGWEAEPDPTRLDKLDTSVAIVVALLVLAFARAPLYKELKGLLWELLSAMKQSNNLYGTRPDMHHRKSFPKGRCHREIIATMKSSLKPLFSRHRHSILHFP